MSRKAPRREQNRKNLESISHLIEIAKYRSMLRKRWQVVRENDLVWRKKMSIQNVLVKELLRLTPQAHIYLGTHLRQHIARDRKKEKRPATGACSVPAR